MKSRTDSCRDHEKTWGRGRFVRELSRSFPLSHHVWAIGGDNVGLIQSTKAGYGGGQGGQTRAGSGGEMTLKRGPIKRPARALQKLVRLYAGFRVQGAGCRVKGAGCRVQGAGCRVQGAGCRVKAAACSVQRAGCRVQGAG